MGARDAHDTEPDERGWEKAAGQARQLSTRREQTSRARVSKLRDTTLANERGTVTKARRDTQPLSLLMTTAPKTPGRQMAMYAIQPSESGRAKQATEPTIVLVLKALIVLLEWVGNRTVKENLAEGDSPRDEDMTAEEEGESEVSAPTTTPEAKPMKKRATRAGRRGVPQKAEVIVLTKPRMRKCDRCVARNRPCLPREKGGRLLDACSECFGRKVSCQTGGMGGRKSKKSAREMTDSREISEEDERGRGWMAKHSMTKVGPPRHAKATGAMTEDTNVAANAMDQPPPRRTTARNAGLIAKKRLERYCELPFDLI